MVVSQGCQSPMSPCSRRSTLSPCRLPGLAESLPSLLFPHWPGCLLAAGAHFYCNLLPRSQTPHLITLSPNPRARPCYCESKRGKTSTGFA